jgi:hypothetical protein
VYQVLEGAFNEGGSQEIRTQAFLKKWWVESAYQSLLFLLNAACLAEKQQIPIL